jgi:hypothetical protein
MAGQVTLELGLAPRARVVAAGGPAPQAKYLERRALKMAPNRFPFVQPPVLNQRTSFRDSGTPSKYELSRGA